MEFVKETFSGNIQYALDKNKSLEKKIDNITLKDYQHFTAKTFLGLKSIRSLLLFWETGSGKTLETIFIMKHLSRLSAKKWKVFILVKASLHYDPWENSINKYLGDEIDYSIIHYDDQKSYLVLLNQLENLDKKTHKILFVIDEGHNFISRSLVIEGKEKKTGKLFDIVKQYLDGLKNKLIIITATPIINNINEFNKLIQLIRNDKIELFSNDFFNNKLIQRDLIEEILTGCCSYHVENENTSLEESERSEIFPSKKVYYKNIKMTEYQSQLYDFLEKKEMKSGASGFRILRRLGSTFTFRGYSDSDGKDESFVLNFLKSQELSQDLISHFKKDKLIDYLNEANDLDFFDSLKNFSIKYIETCFIILNSPGKCLVYEPFVSFEGIKLLKEYFRLFGISFIEFSKETKNIRDSLTVKFNDKDNINGEKIKVCVFSTAGMEGISYTGINDMIILDIPWSDANLRQIIGRGIRLNSHIHLPIERQNINIHILVSSTINGKSIDKEMLDVLLRKYNEIKELYSILKSSSLEKIYERYPNPQEQTNENKSLISSLEKKEFKRITNVNVIENKNLTLVYYKIDNVILVGYLDKNTKILYDETGFKVKELNDIFDFEIIDKKPVYLID